MFACRLPMITVTSQTMMAPRAPRALTVRPSEGNNQQGTERASTKPSHQRIDLTRCRTSGDSTARSRVSVLGIVVWNPLPQCVLRMNRTLAGRVAHAAWATRPAIRVRSLPFNPVVLELHAKRGHVVEPADARRGNLVVFDVVQRHLGRRLEDAQLGLAYQ